MKKRLLSIVLALALCLGLLPAVSLTASAADTGKAIQLGTGGISGYDSTNGYDYIYMGYWTAPDENTTSGPIKWRVLDDQTNTGGSGLFLLSDVLLGTGSCGGVYFDNSEPYSSAWQNSSAQAWCKDFAGDAFTAGELSVVLATTKSDQTFDYYSGSKNILSGDKVFFLSAEEANKDAYGFRFDDARVANYGTSVGAWWLRSPYGLSHNADQGVIVFGYGNLWDYYVNRDWAARPAFNLDLSSVLFTSAADGSAQTAFAETASYTGSEWKVTLKDGNSFATDASVDDTAVAAGEKLTVTHKALSSFTDAGYTNVTAMLTDRNGNILCYGSINDSTSATKSTITIPAGLAAGTYTLSVYGEDWNGEKMTDYATGTPFTTQITVHVHNWTFMNGSAGIIATCDQEGCTSPTVDIRLNPGNELTYNGIAKTVKVEQNPYIFTDLPAVVYTAEEGSALTDGKPVNVGSYKATLTYHGATAEAKYAITPMIITPVSISGSGSKVFDGTRNLPNPITMEIQFNDESDESVSLSPLTDYTIPSKAFEDAARGENKNVQVTVRLTEGGNYIFADNSCETTAVVTSSLSITNPAPTVSFTETTKSGGYTGGAQAGFSREDLTITGASGDEDMYLEELQNAAVTFTYYTDEVCSTETNIQDHGADEEGGAPVNTGTYYVKAATAATDGYLAGTSTNYGILTIIGQDIAEVADVSFMFSNQTYTYNGEAHKPEVTVTKKAGVDGTPNVAVSYSNNINAGTATVTVWGTQNLSGSIELTFTIQKAEPTLTAPTAVSGLIYNGEVQALVTAGTASGGTMQYALGTDAVTAPTTGWSTAIPTGTNAGTYYVWYKVVGDSNHNDSEAAVVEGTISKATLNLAAYSWSDSTGFVYDGTQKAVLLVDQLPEGVEVSYTGNTGTYAGNYTATATFALSEEAEKNYELQNADQQICNWAIQTVAQNPTIVSDVYMKAGDSLDLSTLVSGYQGDTVSFEMSGDAFTLNGNTLTAKADATDGKKCSVTVKITGKDMGGSPDFEYAAYEANAITVTVTELTVPVVSAENITAAYTGKPVPDSAIKGSATADGIAVAGSWWFQNGREGPVYVSESGEYVVIFAPEDPTAYAPVYVAVTVTVIPATPTGTPTYTKITFSGMTLADAALTAGSITPAGGTIVWDLGDAQTVSANTSYSWTYTPADTTNYNVLTGNITPYTVSYSGGGYTPSTPGTESVTVPISGDDNTIHVDASVSGDKATVDNVDLDKLDSVIGDHVDTGTVTIDFSGLNSKEPITTVEIPSNVVKEIAAAVNDPNNDTQSLKIILSDGMSIEFDAVALGEKAAQADGKDITISIEHHEDVTLTEAQKNAVGDRPAFDINVTSGGEHISDMGGKISVHLPYELAEGEDPDSIVVFYVDEHGNRERCETSYHPIKKRVNWKTDHLSLYMIDHCPSAAFADLDVDAWYHEATDYVITNGMMAGYGETFGPNDSITRGQIVTILHRLEGAPVVNYLMTYEDVAQEKYYTEAIRWATSEGIVGGYGNGKFGPDDPITRQQLATILWRYSQYKGYDISVGEDTNILSYEDAFDISEYAIPAMQWACGAGVMGGYGNGYLGPNDGATRAQAAQMMKNFLVKAAK